MSYAPTVDKAMDQAIFGQFLYNTIERFFGESVILGGDLNCNLQIAIELEEYETINSEVEEYYEQKAKGTFVHVASL